MAYIHKRGKKWSYTVSLGMDPSTGKQIQQSKSGFSSKKEAQLAASQIEEEVHKGMFSKESNLTFEQVVNEWMIAYEEKAKNSSLRARRIALKHLLSQWRNHKINSISKQMYQKRINELSRKYSANYIESIHISGKMVFEFAKKNEMINNTPTDYFEMPKRKVEFEDLQEEELKDKFLEKEELKSFLMVAFKEGLDVDYCLFYTLAFTGLRIGELLALQWSDISFEEESIRIRKTLYNPNNNKSQYQFLTPKTKGSIRKLNVDTSLLNELKKHRSKQRQLIMKNRKIYNDMDFVFATDEGFPLTHTHARNRLNRLLKRFTTEKKITPHSFRHTYTSLLIEAGVDIKVIQERLGHTDINTTMNIYAHVTKNLEKIASQKFKELMGDFM